MKKNLPFIIYKMCVSFPNKNRLLPQHHTNLRKLTIINSSKFIPNENYRYLTTSSTFASKMTDTSDTEADHYNNENMIIKHLNEVLQLRNNSLISSWIVEVIIDNSYLKISKTNKLTKFFIFRHIWKHYATHTSVQRKLSAGNLSMIWQCKIQWIMMRFVMHSITLGKKEVWKILSMRKSWGVCWFRGIIGYFYILEG